MDHINDNKADKSRSRAGFTLVELLVTIVILGILTAIAIPIYNGVTDNANKKAFESNHSIIVSAINMYTTAHNGKYPPNALALVDGSYLLNDKGVTVTADTTYDINNIFNEPSGASYIYTGSTDGKSFTLTSTYKDLTYTYKKGA